MVFWIAFTKFVLGLWLVLPTLKAVADSSDSCIATSVDIT